MKKALCGCLGDVAPVAGFAGPGRGFVKENHVSIDRFPQSVACRAGDIFVAALERELSLFVIEERGAPLIAVVASGAVKGLLGELVSMRVFMAIAAFQGRPGEVHVLH